MIRFCVDCRGEVVKITGDYITYVNGIRVVVPNTPHGRCQKCGETYIDYEDAGAVDEEAKKYYDKVFVLENNLKKVREDLGLTIDEVALRMGFSKSRYSQIENSKKAPGIYIALRLAHVLGCDVNDLFRLQIAARPKRVSLRSGKSVSAGN